MCSSVTDQAVWMLTLPATCLVKTLLDLILCSAPGNVQLLKPAEVCRRLSICCHHVYAPFSGLCFSVCCFAPSCLFFVWQDVITNMWLCTGIQTGDVRLLLTGSGDWRLVAWRSSLHLCLMQVETWTILCSVWRALLHF